jgi:hypothetical protein
MHQLLTQDPRLVLGLERFGSYLNEEFGPQLYRKARFFDFESDPRDQGRDRAYYRDIAASYYDSAAYLGDKIPLLYLAYQQAQSAFPDAKYIVLLRNIFDIANSYEARRLNERDAWTFGVGDAVDHWNALLSFLILQQHNPRIQIVFYEQLFGGLGGLESVYEFLELDPPGGIEEFYERLTAETARRAGLRTSLLKDAQKLHIMKTANFSAYQMLVGI